MTYYEYYALLASFVNNLLMVFISIFMNEAALQFSPYIVLINTGSLVIPAT